MVNKEERKPKEVENPTNWKEAIRSFIEQSLIGTGGPIISHEYLGRVLVVASFEVLENNL